MLTDHLLSLNGGLSRSLLEWGFTSATLESRGDGSDTLNLEIARTPMDAPLFPMHGEIRLFDPNGIRRFTGTVSLPRFRARGGMRSHSYTAEGLSWQLKAKMFRQQWNIADVNPTTGEVTYSSPKLSLVTLFRTAAGAPVNVRDQVREILEYAQSLGISFTYNLDNLPTLQPQAEEVLDLRIWDALEAALKWCPEVSRGVRYSSGTPHLYFTRAAAVTGRHLHAPSDFEVRTLRLGDLEEYECIPRDDLLVRKMKITYLRPLEVELPDGTTRVPLELVEDESTVSNGTEVDMESTVRLSNLVWTGAGYESPDPIPAAGLAESLHEAFARLSYELTFSRVFQFVDWAPKCGEFWNILDAGPEMAEAYSICQGITRNLGTGRITIRCGLAAGLNLSGRLQLLRPNRIRKVPEPGGQQYGFGDDDEKKDGKQCDCDCDCDDSGSGGPIDSGEL